MHKIDYLTSLLGIQGTKVTKIESAAQKGLNGVILDIERTSKEFICGRCNRVVNSAYNSRIQVVQHLRLWQHLTFLKFKRYRVGCPDCGVTTEAVSFVEP